MADDQAADLAVVVVHGIGSQRRAAALLDYAEPLVAWADAWSRARGGSGARVVASALLQSSTAADVRVAVSVPGGGVMSWLLTEAWWSEAFPPPRPAEVLVWARRFIRRAAARLLAEFIRPLELSFRRFDSFMQGVVGAARAGAGLDQAVNAPEQVAQPSLPLTSFTGVLWLVAGYFVLTLGAVLNALLYLVLLVGGIGALALGTWLLAVLLSLAVRIPIVRGKVAGLVTVLVTSIGDAEVWRQRPVRAAAMVDVVRERIRWANAHAMNTVVVAHSQGAAIAHRTLIQDDTLPATGLVTIGAAIGLLGDTAPVDTWSRVRPDTEWINIWSHWDVVSSGPIADSPEAAATRWQMAYEDEPRPPQPSSVSDPVVSQPAEPPTPAPPPQRRSTVAAVGAGATAGLMAVDQLMKAVVIEMNRPGLRGR